MCYDYEKGSHKPSIKNRKEDPSKSRNERTQKGSLHLQHRQNTKSGAKMYNRTNIQTFGKSCLNL